MCPLFSRSRTLFPPSFQNYTSNTDCPVFPSSLPVSMSLLHLKLKTSVLSPLTSSSLPYNRRHFLQPQPKPKSLHLRLPSHKPFLSLRPPPTPPNYLKPLNSAKVPRTPDSGPFLSFSNIAPFLLSQRIPILLGWLFSLLSVLSLSRLIPRVGKLSSAVGTTTPALLRTEVLVLSALLLAKLGGTYGQQAFLWEAALNAAYEIRVFVFRSVLDRELGFFEGESGVSSGDIAYRITAEAADVADTLYAILNAVFPSVLQLTAMAMQMLVISPALSVISALVIPCVALATACLGERLQKISNKAHLSVATLSAYLNEVLPAIFFVKANNSELCEDSRFQKLAHADLTEHLKKKKMKAFIPQIIQIIYFGALCTLCVGSLVVSGGCFDGCTMVSFVTSLVFLIEPIQDFGKAYNDWKQGEPAIRRLFDLTRLNSKVMEKPDAVELDNVSGDVKFCNVSFRYNENMPFVLDGLDLHVKAGETVALVGPSGGGKTSLVKLLLRLYEPSSGCIFLDDQEIQSIQLESLRRHVGVVSQDTTLFSGTVAENIGYVDLMSEIDMEKVELAARTANVDEFIRMLPHGYQTNIGPRGSSLSGGQKQRLAIARALYKNSSILIMDEATSALDSRSELLIRQAVERITENHTVLVIAHRLETVRMANRVFLLEDGKLKELNRTTLLGGRSDSLVSSGLVI